MRREVRSKEKISTFSLRSTKIEWSSSDGPRFKFEVLDEGYAWTRNSKFCKGFVLKVRGVKSFGFKKCSRDFLRSLLTLQEVGNLPTKVYFPSRCHFGLG